MEAESNVIGRLFTLINWGMKGDYMDYIGSVPTNLWDTVQKIATSEAYPMEQPDRCPYILLCRVNEGQVLALSGLYAKGHIDLMVIEVQKPGLSEKDREPIDQLLWNKAHALAQELMARAFSQNSQKRTSSTTNNTKTTEESQT